MADIDDAFEAIFDAVAPIITDIAEVIGFPLNLIVGFLFGGFDFLLTEILF